MKQLCNTFLFILTLWSSLLFAQTSQNELEEQREIFGRAEHALKNNDRVNYERLSEKIKSYPLYPYLVYEDLKQQIANTKPSETLLLDIKNFENKYPDFPFTNSLRNQWLSHAALHKNWDLIVKGYQPSDNEEQECNYLFAQYQLTKQKTYLDHAKPLWLVRRQQPAICDQLFNTWHKAGGLSNSLIWQKIQLALEAKNFTLAKQSSKLLPKPEQAYLDEWIKVVKDPKLIESQSYLNKLAIPEKIKLSLLAQGVRLLAKLDAEKALSWWKEHQNNYPFSDSQIEQVQQSIGVCLAHQKTQHAREWLADLADEKIDQVTQEWRIRLALGENDWHSVLHWIDRLPKIVQKERDWLYWRARALEETKQPGADFIYAELAKTRTYYGFLASLRLKQKLNFHNEHVNVSTNLIQQVTSIPAIQRFEELQLLGKTALARVEWFRAVNKMQENEVLAAAKIAQEKKLYDIAILTIAKTKHKDDIALRFPIVHKDIIITAANKHNLDPAWIFAITRQESAFFDHALSPAGARGLMQLLPTTAQELAKKYDIPYAGEHSLHVTSTNIQLGTVFLKNLKERLYHHSLIATAAYNAGPGNAKRWLPKDRMNAEIWVETLPFKETREYVKNVMTFTTIYQHRLGHAPTFALMMEPIQPTP